MIIRGTKVFDPKSCRFVSLDFAFDKEKGIFTELTDELVRNTPAEEIKDFNNQPKSENIYAVAGLMDTHIHGAMGADFCDGSIEAVKTIAEYEARRGITTLVPATMTMPEEVLVKVGQALRQAKDEGLNNGSSIEGIHMEGPFINIDKKGAQNPKYIHLPETGFYKRLQKASGDNYKIVTMAPEVEGAMEFIDNFHEEISISVGHTTADYNTASEAFSRGANRLTHCYNAMEGLHHRKPGPIAAAADHEHTFVELIADAVHSDPAMVRLAFRIFGKERIVFISDSMRATGLGDGIYNLGGQDVSVRGAEARIENGSLAGSVSDLFTCVQCAVQKMKIPLEHALLAASYNPAKAIGLDDKFGSIEPGKFANILLFNEDFSIVAVWVKGKAIKS